MPHLMTSPAAAAGSERVYVVHRTSGFPAEGSSFRSAMPEEHTTDSAYLCEDQAYAAAIRRQIAYMERQTGDAIPELRAVVTKPGASFKDRFESMREWIERTDWFADAEVVEYHVEPCPLARLEKIEAENLLDGLDEQDYTTESSSQGETDEEDDDPEDDTENIPNSNGNGNLGGKKRRRD